MTRRHRWSFLVLALVVGCATGLAQVMISCTDTERDDILTKGEKLYSQNDEELIIRHFFEDRRGGFFLDVGAFDWKKASTTLYLERHLGWSGIAIDAQEKYAQGYEKNRPQTKFFTYLVTDHSGDFGTLYVAGPLSSVDNDNVESFPGMKDFKPKPVQVATITLDDLLERNGIESIDFLSMDIEGAEPLALAGFDIERFRPELVCIEVQKDQREKITAYFQAHGYERIDKYLDRDRVNWYYKPKDVPDGEAPPSSSEARQG